MRDGIAKLVVIALLLGLLAGLLAELAFNGPGFLVFVIVLVIVVLAGLVSGKRV